MTKKEKKRIRKQLHRAHEIRKFEIGLYWKRATYFWTLLAAAFVAFFAIQAGKDIKAPNKQISSFVVANLGFVFSLGWYFINRGSKFWQENWEIQVDRLENCLEEKLYRLVAQKKKCRKKRDGWLVGPGLYSVSKINQITSLYVILVWIILWIWSGRQWYEQALCSGATGEVRGILIVSGLVSLAVWALFHCKGRTDVPKKDYCYGYCLVERTPKKCDCQEEYKCADSHC